MTELVKYDAACRAVAEAKAVDEVKQMRDKADAMRVYAKQANNKQLEVDAAEIRMRAERRVGELIQAQKETEGLNRGAAGTPGPGRGNKNVGLEKTRVSSQPTLAEAGIDKNLADRARKLSSVPEHEFEGMVGEWRERVTEENERVTTNLLKRGEQAQKEAHNHRAQGTGENEWYTPPEYISAAKKVMGGIDLDPATSPQANQVIGASQIMTVDDDGLAQDWNGKVWLNPPYSQPAIHQFCEKTVAEWDTGRIDQAIVLTHNYTDTRWFHILTKSCAAICFTRGRIGFVSTSGEKAAPTQGQAFFYFGSNADRFIEQFQEFGFIAHVIAAKDKAEAA